MPKCGSTWLQKHFFRPRHGFVQALSTFDTLLLFVKAKSFQWQDCRAQLDMEKADKLVPVVSLEVLVGEPLSGGSDGEAILQRLHQTLPDARVLFVIREQRAMLRSLYKSLVTFGYPYKIDTVLYNDLVGNIPTFDLSYLCYHYPIEAYQRVFGKDSVLVLPYELFSARPGEFMDTIRSFCGIEADRFPIRAETGRRENINRSLVSLEIKRLFNRYVAKTRFSVEGLYKPTNISGKGNYEPPVPGFVERWLERRFAEKVRYVTEDYFAESNDRVEAAGGLNLAEFGYQLTRERPGAQPQTEPSTPGGEIPSQ
jgi:hypothetical protein